MPLPDELKPYARPCRGCKKLLLFAVTDTGMRVPLDTVAPTYEVNQEGEASLRAKRSTAYVSHFATCPAARDFSQSNKARSKGAGS